MFCLTSRVPKERLGISGKRFLYKLDVLPVKALKPVNITYLQNKYAQSVHTLNETHNRKQQVTEDADN